MNDKIKIYNRMNYPSPNLPIIPQTKNPTSVRLAINNHLALFLFVRISPSIIRAKTELAIYCPIRIITITPIAITPKAIFLIIGLAGFFNQFISKSTKNYPTICVRLFANNRFITYRLFFYIPKNKW